LDAFDTQTLPFDVHMHHYFRSHRALGSKDKRFVSETAYALVRWKGLIDAVLKREASWAERFQVLESQPVTELAKTPGLSPWEACSCPKVLWDWLRQGRDEEDVYRICWDSNFPAPITIRANLAKIDRDALLARLSDRFSVHPCPVAPAGIRFAKRDNFFQLAEFTEGLFEVQDEGSQMVAELVQAEPGQQVLDYCAGSGGKSLAFAHRLEGRGQIYLHDIRARALQEARKRCKRAGLQNYQILDYQERTAPRLKQSMDWVLVDAPCSGTGTLRRNPDMKWRYGAEDISRLRALQRQIFERALSYVKPGGHIVYATCSILDQENAEQIAHFGRSYPLDLQADGFSSVPREGAMDGLFAAVWRKKV
jgi:16S rRNA C967 or C1407 C5-methylase (RsmB/RsmF family)